MAKGGLALSLVVIVWILLAFSNSPRPYNFPDLPFFPHMPRAQDNAVTEEGAELGRHLFYDPILSEEGNLSCGSCHKQEFAFSDAPHAFSKGNKGQLTRRNTLPLFNLAWYQAMFWDGKAASIEAQVFHPVRDSLEMNLPWTLATERVQQSPKYRRMFREAFGEQSIDSLHIAKAIGQFLRTLISNSSKLDRVVQGKAYLNPDELEGFRLVNDQTKGDCLHCHSSDADLLGTTGKFSNNGLDTADFYLNYPDPGLGGITKKPGDYGKFKIPSFRNLAFTAPYMHDGRFKTLEEVLDFYSEGIQKSVNIDSKMGFAHRGGAPLSAEEKRKIIAFLHTLTDSTLISNPTFGSPFEP